MLTVEQLQYWFNHINDLNLKKINSDVKQYVVLNTNWLPISASLSQRLYHLIENIILPNTCLVCKTHCTWKTSLKCYTTYCSYICASKDPTKVAKSIAWKSDTTKVTQANKKGLLNRQSTNLKKYGHTNYLASNQGKPTVEQGKISRSGKQYRKIEKQKRENTMIDRYGKSVYVNVPEFREKTLITTIEKYGTPHRRQAKYIDIIDKINDPQFLLNQHLIEKKSFVQISAELGGIHSSALIKKCKQHDSTFVPQRFFTSCGHNQISSFLSSLNINHINNDRTLIAPLELDIYIPEHKLAIEYCGLYWHSEQRGKTRQYHKTKHDLCKKTGVQLLTIFEDEWVDKRMQVQRKLIHLLNISQSNVYARNTKCIVLTTQEKDQFFNVNHIQGSGPGSITYGLAYNNETVAAISFIKQANNQFVLNRYATSIHVIGGFSKLLKHFQLNNYWNQIISFADQRWSDGKLYSTTGWELDTIIPPDYYYSPDCITRSHKFNYRRKNLHKLLKHFDPDMSEVENCRANDVLRLWDCGKMRFVLNNKINQV
jgi:hypothetical protein